jgi:uncharacterized repeat protein (TIGR03803 family)
VGGGTGQCGLYNCGVVFQLWRHADGEWAETVLYSFQGGDGDGSDPHGGVVFVASGNLYGTTTKGGAYNYGTAFEVTPGSSGLAESLLYSFGAQGGDGGEPNAGPAMDKDGNLYGTTPYGGDADAYGTVYQLTPGSGGWEESVLYGFTGNSGDGDGYAPYAGVILDANGNLYGTTEVGGYQCGSSSYGTVYELAPESGGQWRETILFRFNGKNGQFPGDGALYMDRHGALYGTTENGGSYGGVVFKLTPKGNGHWKETTIYDFQGGANGWLPGAGVVMDKSGNLYGTTDGGGVGCGVIYRLAPELKGKWRYTVLHTFGVGSDGCAPAGNLVLDKKGNLYGGTVLGGTTGNGVIFEITP